MGRALVVFQQRQKFLRRGHSVAIAQQVLELVPVAVAFEPDANPTAGTNVRRREEAIRSSVDHQALVHRLRLAPNRMTAASVMVVCVRVHGEDLVLHPKCGLAPGFHFMGFWKREAKLA